MTIRIEALTCPNEPHSEPTCQNAIPDQNGEFRCRIVDRAHRQGLSINKVEDSISPIILHVKGVGNQTRCMYDCGCLQRMCFGSLVSTEGLEQLINYSRDGEKIIFPEKEEEITQVFGLRGYKVLYEKVIK